MADVGYYGAFGGLGQEIRDMSKEATDRQWQVYQNSVDAQRAENLERLRHKHTLERDKLAGERAAATATTAHQRSKELATHTARTRQDYPTLGEQTAAGKCEETMAIGGNMWCRRGNQATLIERGMAPEEKAGAGSGIVSGAMSAQGAPAEKGQASATGRVPVKAPKPKIKTAEANLIHKMAAGLWGADWDPEHQKWVGLAKEAAPKAQAVSDRASRIYLDADGALTPQEAVSKAAQELFPDIEIRRPPQPGAYGPRGALMPGSKQGMPTGQGFPGPPNDRLNLGL